MNESNFKLCILSHIYYLFLGRSLCYILFGILFISFHSLFERICGIILILSGTCIYIDNRRAYKELLNFKRNRHSREDIINKFQALDVSNCGYVSTTDLSVLCFSLGITLTRMELESALFVLDREGDRRICMEDFMQWWGDSNSADDDLLLLV